MTRPRLLPFRLVAGLLSAASAALAVVLVVLATAVGLQSGPTATAAQAGSHAEALLRAAAAAVGAELVEPAEAVDGTCPWLGVPVLPDSHQVRPVRDAVLAAPRDLGAAVAAVVVAAEAAGGTVLERATTGVTVRDPEGYLLTVTLDGALRIVAESPCVWPAGERVPA